MSGLFTIMSVENDHGPSSMKRHKPLQTLIFAKKKSMLSVRWEWKGVVYFELLSRKLTINSNVYCQQLETNEKRPELINHKDVIFHQDNAWPHTSLVTRLKLRELGPDLAPSDYHFFRPLQNFLNGQTFDHDKAIKSHFVQFIAENSQKLYERGIMNLPKTWQKVIKQNGKYIID